VQNSWRDKTRVAYSKFALFAINAWFSIQTDHKNAKSAYYSPKMGRTLLKRNENKMQFPLDAGAVTRFLLSDIRTEDVVGTQTSIPDDGNLPHAHFQQGKDVPDSVRTEYVTKLREKTRAYPTLGTVCPGGFLDLWGKRLALHLHFPFGNPCVSVSGDWIHPCGIAFCAYTEIISESDQDVPVRLSVSGGATVWLNGQQSISWYPYERNRMVATTCSLPLGKGVNQLVIVCDEYAERDTECGFSLQVLSSQFPLRQRVPLGAAHDIAIRAAEQAMESVRFQHDHFTEGEVTLCALPPSDEAPFVVSLVGATEENSMLGIFHHAKAVFAPGADTATLGSCETFPIGFLRFTATTVCEGVEITKVMGMENFPLSLQPKPAATVALRKRQAWDFLAKYGEQNANRAVALAHVHGDPNEIEIILQRQIAFINDRSDCSDFYLSYFPHLIRSFGSRGFITQKTLEQMKQCILHFRYWFDEPGNDSMCFTTENHALMFHVCQLVCGELYPNETFTNSGMTGVQMQQKAKAMLRPWFAAFFSHGFSEWNSPPYLPIDSLAFGSLYAQTKDSEMRALAGRALDWMFRLLAITSFRGVFSTTSGRTYIKELFANRSNCPSALNFIGAGTGFLSHAGKGIVSFCFSSYEPPVALMKRYETVPEGKAMLWRSSQGAGGYVNLYVYKTSRYLISSAVDFHPGEKGSQEDVFHLLFSPDAQMWINHPGELALHGSARPSYWSGSGYLPRVNQYRAFASVVFNVPEDHPVPFTHMYLPTQEFAKVVQQGKWVFALAKNGGMLAVFNSFGLQEQRDGQNAGREFISQGRRSIYLVRCAVMNNELTFDRFMERICEARLAITEHDLGFVYQDYAYGTFRGGWNTTLLHRGRPVWDKPYSQDGKITWFRENHEEMQKV
jgi:hypothetical protein